MAIHTTRDNFIYGSGAPTMSAKFYGQIYVNTATNPRAISIATTENTEGWQELALKGHRHTVSDFSDLRESIVSIVQQEGISAAILALKGGNNSWEGDWNNFTGSLRTKGFEVISKNSSIGDLKDVELTTGLEANTLLGWNGSSFIPYKVTGASPSTGGIDFSVYLRKDDLVVGLDSAATDKPLAASAGKALLEKMKAEYSPITHTHTGFAPTVHEHANYLRKDIAQTMKGSLIVESGSQETPLSLRNSNGRVDIDLPQSPTDSTVLSFVTSGGENYNSVVFGGKDGTNGGNLTLNFERVHIPTGGITIGETKRSLDMPSLKIREQGMIYVGSTTRKSALDANGGALNGVGQVVFRNPSSSREQSILFPKEYAGGGQPTDSPLYHYLRLAGGEMKTDTALASEQKYISLGGIKIFFSNSDPGKAANEGDIWFKI